MDMFRPGSALHFILIIGCIAFGGFQFYLHLNADVEQERRTANLAMPPQSLASVLEKSPDNSTYRRVTVRGRLTTLDSYLGIKHDSGDEGAKVYTLLEMRDRAPDPDDATMGQKIGPMIMLDTGYIDWPPPREEIPTFEESASMAHAGGPPILTYTGVLLPADNGFLLTPWPNLNARKWFSSNVQEMASSHRVEDIPPFVLFVESPTIKGRRLLPFTPNWRPDHEMNSVIAFAVGGVLALIFVVAGGGSAPAVRSRGAFDI